MGRRWSGNSGADAPGLCVVNVNNVNRAVSGKHRHGNKTSTTKYNLLTFFPKALFEQYRAWTTFLPLAIVLGISLLKEAAEDFKRYRGDREVNNYRTVVLDPATRQYNECAWMDVCPGDVVLVRRDEAVPADLLLLCSSTSEGTCYVETMNLDGETNLKIKSALDATRTLNSKSLCNLRACITCEPPNSRLYSFLGNLEVLAGGSVVEGSGAPANVGKVGSGCGGGLIPVSPNQVLLRGCSLRNTDSIHGAVIYAGHNTKAFQNSTEAPSKRSRVEHIVDLIILFMFSLLTAMCLTTAIIFGIWTRDSSHSHWYLQPAEKVISVQYDPTRPVTVGLVSFVVCFILYGYLIPISLYVSIEIVKVVQSMVFINQDRHMYCDENDMPALARTSNLNEELGMVNTILSDKTGTLTRNVMEFFKVGTGLLKALQDALPLMTPLMQASIAGVSYGSGVTEIERSTAARWGKALPASSPDPKAALYQEHFFNFYDPRLMGIEWTRQRDCESIEMYFRLLAVCHTVIPDGPADPATIRYQAESPDEAALVVAAKAFGFFFFKRSQTSVTVRERTASGTADSQYEVLNVLEFTSTRKRMSVIVRDPAGRLLIFCKGADSVIYERLSISHVPNTSCKATTSQHMEAYGSAGLRTLCLSWAELDPAFHKKCCAPPEVGTTDSQKCLDSRPASGPKRWDAQWSEAKASLAGRDTKLAALSELVEVNLRLLGCTAIEDKLQDGVQQSIEQLAAAGIKLWVLTGDKVETAVNIGYACSLLTEGMRQFRLQAECEEAEQLVAVGDEEGALRAANQQVEEQLQLICAACSPRRHTTAPRRVPMVAKLPLLLQPTAYGMHAGVDADQGAAAQATAPLAADTATAHQPFAMVIDGKALSYALSDKLAPLFLAAGGRCTAVICCRVSPLQKAQVTALVRSGGNVTLAIGDGANDVGMIQKAHIGVGISGQEGRQAVMSADYAIGQFRFLVPLVLIHGRWSYTRLTRMICFFFYKNLLFGITIFAYNMLTHCSGTYMYDDTYMTLYNVFFTFLTPVVVGMFDRDVDQQYILQYPVLYKAGQQNEMFNIRTISRWMIRAFVHCLTILAFVLMGAPSHASGHVGGQPFAMHDTGILMFTCIVLTTHLKIATLIEQWTWLHHLSVWGSIVFWWIFLIMYPAVAPLKYTGDLHELFLPINATSAHYWLLSVLVPVACVLPDYFFDSVSRYCFPTDSQITQEVQRLACQSHLGGLKKAISSRVLPAPEGSSTSLLQLQQPPQVDEREGACQGGAGAGQPRVAAALAMVKHSCEELMREPTAPPPRPGALPSCSGHDTTGTKSPTGRATSASHAPASSDSCGGDGVALVAGLPGGRRRDVSGNAPTHEALGSLGGRGKATVLEPFREVREPLSDQASLPGLLDLGPAPHRSLPGGP